MNQSACRFARVVALACGALAAAACGDDASAPPAPVEDSGSHSPQDASRPEADASEDASMDSGPSVEPPWASWDGSFSFPDAAPYCALHVAAECDGFEDCGGGVCCATFDPLNTTYTSIRCQESCNGPDHFALCHRNECVGDNLECHRSLLVQQDFIGVCVPKEQGAPNADSPSVPNAINCGEQTCIAEEEQCCLRTSFDFGTFQSMPLTPFCAPLGSSCDCATEPPARDAGHPSPQDDEDAGE